ncbi:hypothetical protein MMU07_08990 [Aquiflexum sp. LQ15W]|uniref:hypothetical protein n=1 Tax=Cognataquiflexum nitidum TaxID=2922272 RepID=UPI001F136EBA|nr:hypothetical protein [Cognataquiflexum nitidum]MCH6199714.1 hypothetical protein [Cognataquiflexum nitidum]
MVIFEINTREAKKVFLEIKRLMSLTKTWKLTSSIEITVLDGKIQLVGQGFVKEMDASTTGTCKLVVRALYWFDLVDMTQDKIFKVVVTHGEAMVRTVTVPVQTTFFETDRILRSIPLPANPESIDYWKLEYQGYTVDELQFNNVATKIPKAKKEFEACIRKAALLLRPFRISNSELREIVLDRLREREKVDFRI